MERFCGRIHFNGNTYQECGGASQQAAAAAAAAAAAVAAASAALNGK